MNTLIMRLLYLLNSITNSGGMERIVIDKINHLAGLDGYEVVLAFYGTKIDKSFFPIDERVHLLPMEVDVEGNSFRNKITSFSRLKRNLKKAIFEIKPDVIINANMKLVGWLLPFIYKEIPKIVELHFSYEGLQVMNREIYGNNYLKSGFNNTLRRLFYPRYDRCVVLTEEDKRDWGFKNIEVIPNFTNIKVIDTSVSNKRKVAVNVGRLMYQKNQTVLVEAWGIVNKKAPDWDLEIWGNGELHNELNKLICKLGLESKVRLMGVSHHIEDVYRYASFFVLSSRYEGQPLVMIEAIQSGLPCICFAVNGVRGAIKNGVNGYIIEDMSAEALAEGILKMISNKDEIPDMAKRAKESAKAFEKERIMKRWTDLFEKLTNENRD